MARAQDVLFRHTINSDVAECGGAVVLDVGVRGVEKADEDRDGTGIDKLLPVLVYEKRKARGSVSSSER